MIAVWMLYCVGIGVAFVVVGYALERGLHLAGRPTRWAWVIAVAGSYLVPVASWVRPEAFSTFPAPVPMAAEPLPSTAVTSITSSILHQPPSRSFSLSDLDLPLRWGWGLASIAILVTLAVAATRLVSLRRRWRQATVDGRSVLVSHDVGPAVVGLWSPRVVLPEWALQLSERDRELMLAHEDEHVGAKDPVMLAASLFAVLVAPWNLAVWWQWRRLRLAVEMDCDARVLAGGRSAPVYGELLLRVGQHRSPQALGVAAFGEPVSFLESRIRRMLATMPRWRWAGAAAALVVAVGALVGACETPRPVGPAREPVETRGATAPGIRGFVSSVIAPTNIDQAPAVVSGDTTDFPDLLRLAGIKGRVVLQARIETNGRVTPGSIAVVESPHPALAEVTKRALLRSRFRPALARGRAVNAVVRIVYDFVITGSTVELRRRETMDRMALWQAERLRPWVESNAHRLFPSILEASGPPGDAFLIHDSRRQVYQSALTKLYYLGKARPTSKIDSAALKQALPSFSPGHDAWGVVDPSALRGLVRENVRVIWIHHDPQPKDPMAVQRSQRTRDEQARHGPRLEQLSQLARQHHPEVFGRLGAQVAVALVMDSQNRVLAHAAKTGEARGVNGLYYSGENCRQVLERLLPQYKNAQWSVSGCADDVQQRNVIVYWGVPLRPLTR